MILRVSLFTALSLTLLLTSTARAQTAEIDMEAVHQAYWKIAGADPVAGLHWFEEEVNKFHSGEGYVSVSASREQIGGEPRVVVRGYIDRDGVPGYRPGADHQLFAFVQQGGLSGNTVNYELTDTWNNVYYRGNRSLPGTAFYSSYYVNWRTPIVSYYTPSVRLSYLRTWRTGYRHSPVYTSWRGHFVTWRAGYSARVVRLRTTYGRPRANIVVRAGVRHSVGIRTSVRSSVRGHAGARRSAQAGVSVRTHGNARATVRPAVGVRATVRPVAGARVAVAHPPVRAKVQVRVH